MHHYELSSPHYKSSSFQVWWLQTLLQEKIFCVNVARGSCDIDEFPSSYVKIGDYSPCGREDIKLSIFHVTSRDHVVRGSCNIKGEFPSL